MIPTVPQTPVDAERLALIEHLARGVHAVAWLVACAIVLLGTTTATAAEIELQTAAGISGIVFDRSTNAPVDSFEVTVHVTGRQAHTDTFRDSGGRFAMDLPGRATAIEVRASGYATWARAPCSQAEESLFVEIALERGRRCAIWDM